jgi:hypothetical protein
MHTIVWMAYIYHHATVAASTSSLAFVTQRPSANCIANIGRLFNNSVSSSRHHQASLATFCKMSASSGANNECVGLTDAGRYTQKNKVGDNDVINWKARIDISIAKSRKIRGSNYVQISTVDHTTMEPRCRTVVFRGFLKNVPLDSVFDGLSESSGAATTYGDCVMKMITDTRSNKVKELESFHGTGNIGGNNVEMVWWRVP